MTVIDHEALLYSLALVGLMLGGWELGIRYGHRAECETPGTTRIDDAILALLGLLLAFSFSSAATKHEYRKQAAIAEASAIGDLAGAGTMLEEPARSTLARELREYVDLRLELSRIPYDDVAEVPLLRRTRALQLDVTRTIRQAIHDGNNPSIHTALIAALNETTTAFEKRRAGLRDHVPATVPLMLGVSALASAFCLGRIQGVARRRERGATAMFISLVALVLFVTLDLEQPRRGLVRVPIWALESVRDGMPAP